MSRDRRTTKRRRREPIAKRPTFNVTLFIKWGLRELAGVELSDEILNLLVEDILAARDGSTLAQPAQFAYLLRDAFARINRVDAALFGKDDPPIDLDEADAVMRAFVFAYPDAVLGIPGVPGVKSGDEVRARFGAREKALHARLDAKHGTAGIPSYEDRREQLRSEGRLVETEAGDVIRMDADMAELIKLQKDKFAFKFGRPMDKHDPIFFDEDADQPTPWDADKLIAQLRAAAVEAGVDPDAVHGYFFGAQDVADYKKHRH